MKYRIIDRTSTVLLFDREDTINPSSSFQVDYIGDRARIHSLMGTGFYEMLRVCGLQPFRDMGVKYVNAAVSDGHLRLMRRALPPGIGLEVQGRVSGVARGVDLNWVLLTDLEAIA